MRILNLGCGTKVSLSPEVINIDWSIYLRLKKNPLLRLLSPVLFKGERLEKFNTLPDNIMVYDLKKGIPFSSDSVDVVYHSHVLEHLDVPVAKQFLLENKRVIKEGGILRICVPDLEKICQEYISHISLCESSFNESIKHNDYIAEILEQSVRKEAYSTNKQENTRKLLENLLLGDARKRGETHQWMYDRINLSVLLENLGFKNITSQKFHTSAIPNWESYGLDFDISGNEYRPKSIYIEAEK